METNHKAEHFTTIRMFTHALYLFHSGHGDKSLLSLVSFLIPFIHNHAFVTFSVDINLLIYKMHNIFWRDVVASGDVLNGLKEMSCHVNRVIIVWL